MGAGTSTISKRRRWTPSEIAVLVAIYFSNDFVIGDDSRLECQTIAAAINRTPSAIDRQWRNIDAVCRGKRAFNVGLDVRTAVHSHLSDPTRSRRHALDVDARMGWGLGALIANDGS